jgi:hypothetical protein
VSDWAREEGHILFIKCLRFVGAALMVMAVVGARGQETPAVPVAPETPHGEVIFHRNSNDEHRNSDDAAAPAKPEAAAAATPAAKVSGPELTDADRSALHFLAYDLDAQLAPEHAHLAMRARMTLRNDGAQPLSRIGLQISSTLTWESVTLVSGAAHTRLALAQHLLDSDADHTGRASEAVIALPAPLAPGASVRLDAFYSGTIEASGARLEGIGATPVQAADADWDAIAASGTALRGFGNVLWYPVSAPQLFLGDGAKLFQAVAQMRFREQAVSVRLRLSVEYRGEPPVAAYFCGRRLALKAVADDPNEPVLLGAGVTVAEFAAEPLGFRFPDLFVMAHAETAVADGHLVVETNDEASLPRLAASVHSVEPLLVTWFGPHPLSALTVVDHAGQPFEDGPLLAAPVATLAASTSTPALAHSLTHAYVQTGQPWFDEGLAQFVALLWTEQLAGRAAANAELQDLMRPVALAEPDAASVDTSKGEPLIAAADEVYYRRKAAAVWWMLRSLAGDQALQQALTAWRSQPALTEPAEAQALDFQHLLEKTSGKQLGWFFNDWVLRDRGLPDLSIVDVTPRQLPAGKGHDSGWLVAVTVRNDGAAEVEVPLVVRAGDFSVTRALRVPGLSNVTERVVVEAAPTEVLVNDGSVPELRTSLHKREVVAKVQ